MNFAGPFDSKLLNDSPVSLDGDAFAFGAKPGFVQHHPSDAHVVVPDAHLLFSGSYVRIGNDLIISGSDQKFVVGNYFKGEARPTLSSKDGATLSGQIVDALTGHVVYAQAAAPAAAAAQVIGHVLKLSGSASVIRNGVSVELHIGDAVQKGDVVQTGSDSSVGLTFIDGSAFGMTSNARMVLNEMIYDPNGSSNSSLISLVQGTITFVAGQTAKNGNMRVETPVATMGIRGTAVLVEISANDGPTKFSVLVEPDGHTGSFNLYDKTTGQLIGTVSQAGQVTFVSSLGVGQTPTAVEQLKTLADQQSEKFIIQQVFQLYFPNYTPDDAKPNSPKSNPRTDIGVPENNIGKYAFDPVTGRLTYTVTAPITNPDTHQTTDTKIVFYNIKAAFTATALSAKEESPGDPSTSGLIKLKDAVHIDDPDINVGPFFDVATPFVAHSGVLTAASTTATLTPAAKAALHLDTLLTIDQITGDVSFNRADFNFLAAGEKAEYVIRVTASSGPDSANVFIKVTITGENDAPTIETASTVDAGGVTEDYVPITDNLETSGSIGFQDFDLTDGHTASFALKSAVSSTHLPGFVDGAVGTVSGVTGIGFFSLDAVSEILTDATNTGQVGWHFVLPDNDPVLQSLAAGQTIKQVYTITITDGSGVSVTRDVEVTITGTNDAPVLTADTSIHQADEVPDTTGAPNSVVDVATGTLAFVDVDLSDTHTASAGLHPSATSVVWSGGSYSGIPQATRDALNTAMTAAVLENNSDTHNYGSVDWEFKLPDHLFDFLAHGETLTLIYDVTITDNNGLSSTKQVTVQIGASNDQPVISAVENAAVKEDVGAVYDILKDTGSVTFTDTDLTDTHKAYVAYNDDAAGSAGVPLLLANALATALTVPASALAAGSHTFNWDFALDTNLVQYLAEGETITATYTITVEDNSNGTNDTSAGQVVTVVITGTNDVPTITVTNPANDTEGNAGPLDPVSVTVADHVSITDVDTSDVHVPYVADTLAFDALDSSGPAPAGGVLADLFTLNEMDGTISYDRAAFDYLAAGEHVTATFTFDTSSGPDTVQKSITVTIDGANDAPTVSAALTLNTSEGNAPVVKDLLEGASDVDHGDTLSVTNVRYLIDGEEELTADGVIIFPDAGTIKINVDGAHPAFDHIAAGATETILVSYDVTDVHGATVAQTETITIVGANDRPVLGAGQNFATITENDTANGGQLVSSFATGITDADDGAVLGGIAVTGFTGANGHWQYSLDGGTSWASISALSSGMGLLLASDDKVRFIPDGEHGGSATLTYVAWDQTSGTVGQITSTPSGLHSDAFSQGSQTATLTVTDINDAPVLDVMSHSVTETFNTAGPSPTYTSTIHNLIASDVDGGDFETFTLTATAEHGTLSLAGSGSGVTVSNSGTASLTVSGMLGSLNDALSDGVTYTSGLMDNNVEHVTAVLTDSHGAFDAVNFIFPQNGSGMSGIVDVHGTTGRDVISSNYGSNNLWGDAGNDIFVFKGMLGNDTIKDFHQGEDLIALAGSGFANFMDLMAHTTDVAGNAVISMPSAGTGSLTITGIDKAHLTASDFHIV